MSATIISKTDIIKEVAQQVPQSENDVKKIIEAFWTTLVDHVEKGEDVRFIGLGKFYKHHRSERMGRNPRTGEDIVIEASDTLAFKSAKKFD